MNFQYLTKTSRSLNNPQIRWEILLYFQENEIPSRLQSTEISCSLSALDLYEKMHLVRDISFHPLENKIFGGK